MSLSYKFLKNNELGFSLSYFHTMEERTLNGVKQTVPIYWFKAIDVAKKLGYKNPQKAIRDHVTNQNKKTFSRSVSKQHPQTIFINKDGIKELLVKSRMIIPKQFYEEFNIDVESTKYEKKEIDLFDYIFHLAATIPYKKENLPNDLFIENIHLTCELAKSYPLSRWIYASSVSVYGEASDTVCTIHSVIKNPNLYGLTKLACETIIRNLTSYAIIRFSSLVGPDVQTPTFIPIIIQQAKKEKNIYLFGKGIRQQNYMDYRDAASLMIHCAQREENLIGLGCSPNSVSNNEIAFMVSELCHAHIIMKEADEGPSYIYDNQGFFEKIGFRPYYTIQQTIKDMVDHA